MMNQKSLENQIVLISISLQVIESVGEGRHNKCPKFEVFLWKFPLNFYCLENEWAIAIFTWLLPNFIIEIGRFCHSIHIRKQCKRLGITCTGSWQHFSCDHIAISLKSYDHKIFSIHLAPIFFYLHAFYWFIVITLCSSNHQYSVTMAYVFA